jgi:DNA-binding NtrC family response regulator
VLVLAQHFAARASRRYGRQINLTRPGLETLVHYSFPGNVRELESLIESAAAMSADDPQNITEKDLRPLLGDEPARAVLETSGCSMEQMERQTIGRALRLSEGNRTKAASMLGISRDTLYRKLRQYQT